MPVAEEAVPCADAPATLRGAAIPAARKAKSTRCMFRPAYIRGRAPGVLLALKLPVPARDHTRFTLKPQHAHAARPQSKQPAIHRRSADPPRCQDPQDVGMRK